MKTDVDYDNMCYTSLMGAMASVWVDSTLLLVTVTRGGDEWPMPFDVVSGSASDFFSCKDEEDNEDEVSEPARNGAFPDNCKLESRQSLLMSELESLIKSVLRVCLLASPCVSGHIRSAPFSNRISSATVSSVSTVGPSSMGLVKVSESIVLWSDALSISESDSPGMMGMLMVVVVKNAIFSLKINTIRSHQQRFKFSLLNPDCTLHV